MITLHSRALIVCLVALIAASVSQVALAQGPVEAGDASNMAAEEYLLSRINEERILAGREPLLMDASLRALARVKAADMAENAYFDHVSPSYGTIFEMLSDKGIEHKWAGENIAKAGNVVTAHQALMESPEHRANILSAGYTHVGIGVYRDGNKLYVAQVFMRPRT